MRHIDADAFKQKLADKDIFFPALYKNELDEMPTSDVVPKSEVENYKKIAEHQQTVAMDRYFEIKRLKEELAKAKSEVEELQNELVIWKQNRFNLCQKLECYKMARQKVARDIFVEIENDIKNHSVYWSYQNRDTLLNNIAELKKRNTRMARRDRYYYLDNHHYFHYFVR